MPAPVVLPVIIEPFSTFGDEVAGNTAEEIALNLAAATRTSLAWRCKPRRPVPDLREVFRGCRLSPVAEHELREVDAVYRRLAMRQEATLEPPRAVPAPIAEPQLSLL